MDVLSDILDAVELRGTLYFRTRFSPPYAIAVPAFKEACRFHLVVQGRCHVSLKCGASVALGPGELVLVPRGAAHVLADDPTRQPMELDRVLEQSGYGGDGVLIWGEGATDPDAETQLICGHFTFVDGVDHPLLRALPDLLCVSAAARARRAFLDGALQLVARAGYRDEPGARTSLKRLSEVVFIESIGAASDNHAEVAKVLSALTDPRIGRALALIHGAPGKPWTLTSLATAVGMSRTRFAEHFRSIVGTSPMTYLTEWRLQRAHAQIVQSREAIQVVARKAGFASAAGFTRAFARQFGRPPRDVRRRFDATN